MKHIRVILIVLIGSSLGYLIYDYVNGGFKYQNVMVHHMYSNQSDFSYFVNSVLMTVIIVSVIFLVFSFKKNTRNGKTTALQILDLRLSKGDISMEEYNDIKEALK